MPESPFIEVPEALRQFAAGRMIVVVDDEDRENEGDLTLAAEFTTPEAINFMAKYGRGLICLTLTEERADYLRLLPMAAENTSRFGTAFTESIEAREGVSTGISAADRAHTILTAVSGLIPAGVICEIMNDDGSMARVPDLIEFCKTHDMGMLTVAELIRYRMQHERYIHREAETVLRTPWGEFRTIAYASDVEEGESHLALVLGDVSEAGGDEPVLVRVHTHCLAGGIFCQDGCECRQSVENAMRLIAERGRGALVYLHNGSRGFAIDRTTTPPRMVTHREGAARTNAKDQSQTLRHTGIGGQILSDLGIHRIRLLVSRPTHVPALQGFGIEIVEQVTMAPAQVS